MKENIPHILEKVHSDNTMPNIYSQGKGWNNERIQWNNLYTNTQAGWIDDGMSAEWHSARVYCKNQLYWRNKIRSASSILTSHRQYRYHDPKQVLITRVEANDIKRKGSNNNNKWDFPYIAIGQLIWHFPAWIYQWTNGGWSRSKTIW